MFIRNVEKKHKNSPVLYQYQQLVESSRTVKGPRQKLLLNLGKLPIPKEKWPNLAKRIEDIIRDQEVLFKEDSEIECLALHYSRDVIRKNLIEFDEKEQSYFETINVNTLTNQRIRTIGAEYICYSFFKRLGLDRCLKECGFNERQLEIASLLIIARLVHPGSERHIYSWSQNMSALDELLKTDFSHLSLNSLYQVCDLILKNKPAIESHLREKERDLFNLDETIILYDLTNTYLEGLGLSNPKAKFSKSKEKRNDCRLLTLGLVLDGKGFPKTCEMFAGNQSECKTLLGMVNRLIQKDPTRTRKEKATVVIDAGIATEENLKELKKSYHYIVVSRKKIEPPEYEDFVIIKEDKKNKVEAQLFKKDGEIFLYCKSRLKSKKEKSMQSRFSQYFEEQLTHISKSIHKKGCTKKYHKVIERIGRLKEKYSRISRFYEINVAEKDGLANNITWQYHREKSDQQFSGSYCLRTDREDLSEKEIWGIYVMLNEIEDAFRALKSDLLMRPIFHQKENRSDSHIFITVIAYHLLHSIRTCLKEFGINTSWSYIRDRLSTHCRVTNRFKTKDGRITFIRKCSDPEEFHKIIYDALSLEYIPCKSTKFTI
jgi:hypothetical protein